MNNLVRELGGAFGIGLLGSITLLGYQHGLPSGAPAVANEGLAQAFTVGGGAQSALGGVAREAYSAGLDLAMLAGGAVVVVCALVTFLALRTPALGDRASAPRSVPRNRVARTRYSAPETRN